MTPKSFLNDGPIGEFYLAVPPVPTNFVSSATASYGALTQVTGELDFLDGKIITDAINIDAESLLKKVAVDVTGDLTEKKLAATRMIYLCAICSSPTSLMFGYDK